MVNFFFKLWSNVTPSVFGLGPAKALHLHPSLALRLGSEEVTVSLGNKATAALRGFSFRTRSHLASLSEGQQSCAVTLVSQIQ